MLSEPIPPVEAPGIAEVQARIAEVDSSTDLDDAAKEALLTPLRAALESLQARDEALAQRQQFLDATASVPGTVEQLQAEIDTPAPSPELEDFDRRPADEALEAIRALLTEAQARLGAAQAEQARLQTEAAAREVKLAEGPTQLVGWREALSEATTALAALPEDPSDPASVARRWRQQAQAAELSARIARLEAELASYTARREVLPLRRTLAQRRASAATATVDRLQEMETRTANRVARLAQQQAERQAEQIDNDELRELAEQTSELASRRLGPEGTLAELEMVRAAADRAERRLSDLNRRARNTAARVQAAGLTEVVGRFLRQELDRLPRVDEDQVQRLDESIGRAQLELIDIEDALADVGDPQAVIARARRSMAVDGQPLDPEVEQRIESIVTNYVDMLRSLESEYRDYIDQALALETTRVTLADTTAAFRTYIEERILWTRSVQGPVIPELDDLERGAVWLLGGGSGQAIEAPLEEQPALGSRWIEAAGDLWPPRFVAVPTLLALLISVWLRRIAKRRLKQAANEVRKFSTDRIGLTLAALPLTLLLTLPLPLAMILLGLVLEGTEPQVARSIGAGLLNAAVLAFGLEAVRHIARPDGLAEAHFRWRREGLTHLRRIVLLVEATLLPAAVLVFALADQPSLLINNGLGRALFVATQLTLAFYVAWIFAPWLPLLKAYLAKRKGAVVSQLRWLWYPFIVLSPVALAVLAALGYYYTAAQLAQRLQLTTWLLVAILVVHGLVLRWLFIERRRLLVKRAQQKREAEKAEEPAAGGEVEGIEFETPAELDAAEVDAQTRRVLVAVVVVSVVLGVYTLWTEQMPALRMLDRIQLYPQVEFLEGQERGGATLEIAGEAPPPESTQDQAGESGVNPLGILNVGNEGDAAQTEPIRSLTLSDVGAALILFALTWILARNLPGLLEITLLKRLPLDAGARFAVTSILRYFIGIVGIVLAFGAIGIGWSQVQFLAAALTFGLAFGLQEIFANFISGLIMLVERPVRVGDTVTVNGVDGRITRIRMRATTVLDWELRELVIPNKVFITEHFINWTLSDPRIRVTVPVGVAYGADVRLAQQTLLEIGQAYEHAVTEPRTRAFFLGFGDSTLNFQLRVFVEHFDYYVEAKSILHMRIIERFRELGIEIAFPQRDLNIRDIGPLADAMAASRPGHDVPPSKAIDAAAKKDTP